MLKDLQFAWRTLRAKPVFLAVAVLSLALGIGANTAIFSVVESSLLRGLPYRHSNQLVEVHDHQPCCNAASLSPGEYMDYRDQTKTLSGLAAWTIQQVTVIGHAEAFQLNGAVVTNNFFDVLGARAERGRLMSPKIDKSGGQRVAVISDATWRSFFGSDPKIVGRYLTLNGNSFLVIGVLMPRQTYPNDWQIWLSPRVGIPEYNEQNSPKNIAQQYDNHWLIGLGRLKPGVSLAQARAEFETIAAHIGVAHPEDRDNYGSIFALQKSMVANIRASLMVLFGAVVFLLLIACANLTGLLLARATGRTRELSVRFALGATRWDITRLLLSESFLLAIFGGIFGLALAAVGLRLIAVYSPYELPAALRPQPDFSVLAICISISFVAALCSGLLPALTAMQVDVNQGLKEGSKGSLSRGTQSLRRFLVTAEIAVSLVLLIGAGLLIRSFTKLITIDPGFNPQGVMTARLDLPSPRYATPSQLNEFWSQLLRRTSNLPGIRSAGLVTTIPLTDAGTGGYVEVEGRHSGSHQQPLYADVFGVSAHTFAAMQVPLLAGRTISDRDTAQSSPVVVINKYFADSVFPRQNPIGKRIRGAADAAWRTIVGVVGNIKFNSLNSPPDLEAYYSYAQLGVNSSAIVLRGTVSQSELRAAVRKIDPNIPLTDVKPLGDYLSQSLATRKFLLGLLTTFSGLAILLAAIGLYAILAYSVQQRKQEIGIRIALGANSGDVLWLILRECLAIAIIGTAVGLLGATWATSFLKSMLYGVTTNDLTAYTAAVVVILTVAIAASLAPAIRATRIDPVSALRYE